MNMRKPWQLNTGLAGVRLFRRIELPWQGKFPKILERRVAGEKEDAHDCPNVHEVTV